MSYDYATERPAIFTEDGMKQYTKFRDHVQYIVRLNGAFRVMELEKNTKGMPSSSWLELAFLDYMVEQGELVRMLHPQEGKKEYWAQFHVYAQPTMNGR